MVFMNFSLVFMRLRGSPLLAGSKAFPRLQSHVLGHFFLSGSGEFLGPDYLTAAHISLALCFNLRIPFLPY